MGFSTSSSITVALAALAVFVSFVTLFLAHIRNPDIKAVFGPIRVYRNFADRGGLGVLAVVTFANKAMRTGMIVRAALLLRKEGNSKQGYYMKWREFNKLDVAIHQYVFEDEAHTLAVPGNSTVTRQIWFDYSDPSLVLEKGTYVVTICFWGEREGNGKPRKESCRIVIDSSLYTKLEVYRKTKDSRTEPVPMEGELPPSKLMDESDMKNRLGV